MAYGFYRSLTIDHTKCGTANSTSFPVLVSISGAASVKTAGNGGRIQNTGTQSGGAAITIPFDLVFSSDNAGASKYAWEVESYNGTTGDLIAWVNVPTISHTSDTVLYMVYGDAAVNTQQNTSTFAPSAVWDSNFKGVWHMSDTNFVESTSNAHTLSSNSGTAATGQVDGGIAYASSQTTTITSSSDWAFTTQNFMVEFWMNITALNDPSENNGPTPIWTGAFNTSGWYCFITNSGSGGNGSMLLQTNSSGNTGAVSSQLGVVTTGSWMHLVYMRTGTTTAAFYKNGVALTGLSGSLRDMTSSSVLKFAAYSGSSNFFPGTLDEIRISAGTRATEWILTGYNNQNAPGNIGTPGFITFGAEIGGGGTVTGNPLYGGINPLQGFFS